jgi:hypothetical protein
VVKTDNGHRTILMPQGTLLRYFFWQILVWFKDISLEISGQTIQQIPKTTIHFFVGAGSGRCKIPDL